MTPIEQAIEALRAARMELAGCRIETKLADAEAALQSMQREAHRAWLKFNASLNDDDPAKIKATTPAQPKVPEASEITKELCSLYWSAYDKGHNDTVEACFIDVHSVDRFDYWQDQVADCVNDGDMPEIKTMLSAQLQVPECHSAWQPEYDGWEQIEAQTRGAVIDLLKAAQGVIRLVHDIKAHNYIDDAIRALSASQEQEQTK